MVVVALTKRLHLKPARQDSTARIHRRSSAWSALLDIQAQNQQQNVKHGKYILLFFFFASFHFYIFLTRYLIHFFFFLLLRLNHTATRESPTPTLAVDAQNAHRDSSKIKAPFQALRAKIVQQDTTTPSMVPRRALILVA